MTASDHEPENVVQEHFESLVVAYHEALLKGTAPPPIDDATLPLDLVNDLHGIQACLELLDTVRQETTSAKLSAPVKNSPPASYVGRFRIIRELGRGGYGIVFLAFDPRLERKIALKIPRPEVLVGVATRTRFLREAQAAGALEHPNLIPIFEVGEDGPVCYIASAFCDGPNLAQWLTARGNAVPIRQAVKLVYLLAGGIDHAHRRGVLHRDIKPSNILLESSTEGVTISDLSDYIPRLTDFGLAKLLEMPTDETRTGALLGTPAYMAPEQAEGRIRDIGPATDVYALGVLLYELVAGRPPFRADSDVQLLQLVAQNEVPHPRLFCDQLSRDLEAIILKCLEGAPARRYGSAGQLAGDLDRFLTGNPTLARPAGSVVKLTKWVRRRPAIASLLSVLLLSAMSLASGGWWYSRQLQVALAESRQHELESEQHALEARQRELETKHFLNAASVNLAARSLTSDNIQQARDQLARSIPTKDEPDLRRFAWHHLWQQLHEEERTLIGHTDEIYCVRFSPDGNLLATASKDQTARVWDLKTGKCSAILSGHQAEVNSVAFSADGKRLASASDDGTVIIWDLATFKVDRRLSTHPSGTNGVGFSRDGTRMATCGRDRDARLWDTATWQPVAVLSGHQENIGTLAFSPDGEVLATASDDGQVRLWNADSGEAQEAWNAHQGSVSALSFSQDGTRLVTAGRAERQVRIWETSTGNPLMELPGQYSWVHAIQFCQHDTQVAIATKDGGLKLFDASTGQVMRQLLGHAGRIWSIAISPDGQYLADASADRTVKIWNLARGASHELVQTEQAASRASQLSHDGQLCVTGNETDGVAVWDLAAKTLQWDAGRDFEIVGDFNGDGIQDDGYFRDGFWNLRVSRSQGNGASVRFVEQVLKCGIRGDIPLVGDWNGDGQDQVAVYRAADRLWYFGEPSHGPNSARLFGSDDHDPNKIPLAGHWDSLMQDRVGFASFRDNQWYFKLLLASGEIEFNVKQGDARSTPICWTASDNRLILGCLDKGRLKGHVVNRGPQTDPADGSRELHHQPPNRGDNQPALGEFVDLDERQLSLEGLEAAKDRALAVKRSDVAHISISPRGDLIAVVHELDSRVKIWELQSGRRLGVLRAPKGNVLAVAFAPQDHTLVVGTDQGEITFWDASKQQQKGSIVAHSPGRLHLAYSHHGRWLATSGDEGVLKLWDAETHSQIRLIREGPEHEIHCLAFSADDQQIAVGGTDRLVTIWKTTTGELIARLASHTNSIESVAFSPDGGTLASASTDHTLRLWDLFTRQELYCLEDGLHNVMALTFSPAGRSLIATANSSDGKLQVHRWWAQPPTLFRQLATKRIVNACPPYLPLCTDVEDALGSLRVRQAAPGEGGLNWSLEPVGDGYFRLVSAVSGLCLTEAPSSIDNAEDRVRLAVSMASSPNSFQQQWRIEPAGLHYVCLVNRASNHALEMDLPAVTDQVFRLRMREKGEFKVSQLWTLE